MKSNTSTVTSALPPTVYAVKALQDNYIWLIVSQNLSQCLIVDPGESAPVLQFLTDNALTVRGILLTHHHWDHTKGVAEILKITRTKKNIIPVFGPSCEAISTVTVPLVGGEILDLADKNFSFKVIATPGHTQGHICYYGHDFLFCGDTLFTGGCGRVFEGTSQQLYTSLQALANLPPQTLIYCGHEYTAMNLTFAELVEPNNSDLKERIAITKKKRQAGLATVPSTLALEKATNPFLRCHETSVKQAVENYAGAPLSTPDSVFQVLRQWKSSQ